MGSHGAPWAPLNPEVPWASPGYRTVPWDSLGVPGDPWEAQGTLGNPGEPQALLGAPQEVKITRSLLHGALGSPNQGTGFPYPGVVVNSWSK